MEGFYPSPAFQTTPALQTIQGRINIEVVLYNLVKKEVTCFFSPLKVPLSKSTASSPAGVTSPLDAAFVGGLAMNAGSSSSKHYVRTGN